jgi:2-desacetyl-2-hydroxyethyl bacteriochlorophyllide A dehydrogenase
MRAMVLRGKDLAVEEVPRPAPGPGQVLARVRACGICGSDLHFALYAEDLVRATGDGQTGVGPGIEPDKGVIMGHEFVAEVVEAGPDVDGWPAGTRVVSLPTLIDPSAPRGAHTIGYSSRFPGAYGEYVLMSAPLLLRVPDHVPDVVAATTEPCAVGLHAVREGRVQPAEHALVMGAGPIGMMTLLWLKHAGVRHVTVSEPAAPRRELAARLGADLVLDPATEDVAGRTAAAAGGPPPVVFECVGVAGTIAQAMRLAAPRGRVVVVGACMTEDRITPMVGINKHLTLQFVLGYTPQEVAESLDAIAAGRVDPAPLITRTVTLDELPAAFRALANPRDCKVVLAFE